MADEKGIDMSEAQRPPVVEELARWAIGSEGVVLAILRYGKDAAGQYTYELEGGNENVSEFLDYYIEDPLNSGRVYVHGLGVQKGPHTRDPEQFDVAMSTLPFHFPSWETERLND